MPTYVVCARADAFTAGQRADLARSITALHSKLTGAPRSFVQTVFQSVEPGAHYIGAEPADPRGVWVHGHIREGRAAEVRTAIALGIADALEAVAQVPRSLVWVYLSELAHTDMIEFGAVLPAPGGENAWIDGLDPAVRDRLRALG